MAGGALFVLADPRRNLLARRPVVRPEPWWNAALRATYPSTVGLAVLCAIGLAFSAILSAVLAGVIAGLGVAGLASVAIVFFNRS